MDFELTEASTEAAGLADRVFADHAARRTEFGPDGFSPALWADLTKTALLDACLGEDVGGLAAPFETACAVLMSAGRVALPAPLWPHVVASLAIDRWGTAAQRAALLGRGETFTVALAGPAVTLADGVLSGHVDCVPLATHAGRVLVPAGDRVAVVRPDGPGVTATEQTTTSGTVEHRLAFDGAPADELLAVDPRWLRDRALVLIAATQVGLNEGALALTATYVTERHQFGRPLATLQAVQHRVVDCHVENEAVRWTMWEAATRLDRFDRAEDAAVLAKYLASEASGAIMSALAHVHGGTGVDVSYPLHHYYLAAKHLELTLGAAPAQLSRLGRLLAEGRAGFGTDDNAAA